MLFASWLYDVTYNAFWSLVFFLWLISWCAGRAFKKFDSGGAVKGSAQKAAAQGVSDLISKWLR